MLSDLQKSDRGTPAALHEDPYREAAFFDRFSIVWHVITLVSMAAYLALALNSAIRSGTFGPQHAALIALTAAQAGIYVYAFVRADCWPPNPMRLFANFVVGPAIVFAQQAISPVFANMWWVYFGHNFSGALPPRLAIPHMGLMCLFFFGAINNWQFGNAPSGVWIAAALTFGGSIIGYLVIRKSTEMSETRSRMLGELQQAYRELDAAREREAEYAVLKERERLARDMHDNLGHTLVALSVQLEAAQRLYKKDPERASAQMDAMKALTRESMDALRRTLAGLRAPGLGNRPLRQAVQETGVALSQRSGMAVRCQIAPEADGLNPALTDALWGATQEALTNIEKHARARHAEVIIDVAPRGVTLTVSDDGVGLPPDALDRTGHYGLRGMRERIEGVGGALRLHSALTGTRVEATIPTL